MTLAALVAAPGANSVRYVDTHFPGQPLTLYAARPAAYDAATPIVFVHHGVGRNGRNYRDYWLDLVDEAGILAISVEFSEASFPEYLLYNMGNLRAKDGTPNPRDRWTYGIDERLFGALRREGVTSRVRYGLFGHSAGGQFVHRMVSFGFRDHVAIAVSANAGTYAMPDLGTEWPWGLGGTDVDEAALRALLGFRITVMAGTDDVKTDGRFFPSGPRSMLQGATRHERGHAYVRAGRAAAQALGARCAWTVIDVAGVGHDGKRMSGAAAPIVAAALHASEWQHPASA